MGGGERKKSIRKRSSSGNSSGSGSGTWDGVGDECGNLPIASASTTMTDDGSRTLALSSPEPIRPASLAFSPPSSSSLSLPLSSSALPPTTAPTTLQQRRSRFAPPPSEPLLPLPPPPPPPPGSSSSCASLCAGTAQSAATTAILPRPVALPHTPAPLRRWAEGVDSSSSSSSSSSAAAPVSASYAAAGSLMVMTPGHPAPLSGSGLRPGPGPGPGPGPASVAISSANGGKGGWVQSQKQQYQHQHQHQHQRPRRLAPHHRIRSLLHAQYLHITRKRLPFLGRQIDRFWDLSPRGRLAAFLAFAAWKFFVTFVVMGALLKRGHEMMTTSTIVSEAAAAAAAAAGKGGGVSEARRGEGASLASASAAAAAVGRVLGLEPPLSDAAIMHTDGDGNGRTTLKVLYVLTALSAPPPEADEELTKSWFDDVFRPVLTEGLATDGVSYPSSSLPSSSSSSSPPSLSLHVAMEMDVDLYVIAPTSPRNERRPEVNQGGTDLLASLVADALPPGVGLELWDDALPAPYPPASSSSLSSSSSSSLSPTDRADLARRHRHVIRDKLLEYDVFVSFDDLAIIKAEHVARYWWMSLELERAERETMVSRHFRIPPPLPPQAVFGGVVGAFPSEEGTGAEAEAAAETATNRRRRNEIIIPGLLPVNIVSNKSPNDGMKSETNGAAVNVDHTICCGSAVGRTDRLVLYDPPSVVSGGSIRRIRPPRPLSTSDLGTKSDVAAPLEWIWTMPAPQHFSLSTAVVRSRRKPHDLAWKGRFLHKNETVATSGMGGWMITRNQLLRALSSDDGACRSFLPPFDDENDNDNNNGNESNDGGDGATVDDGDDGDNDRDDAAARERYWMDGLQLFMPPSLGGCGVGRVTGTDAATISGQLVRRRTGDPQDDVGSAAVNEGASTYAVGVDDFLNRLATEREILEESYGKKRVEAQ